MNSFNSNIEKDMFISITESNIEIDKDISEYFKEVEMSCLLDYSPFCEASESAKSTNNTNKFVAIIHKILEAVKKTFTSLMNMIKNMFSGKENMSAEDYLKSPSVQIQFDEDYQKISEKVEQEILKGRKIVQAISKGTGVDDKVVANYCDAAAKGIQKIGIGVVLGSAAIGIGKLVQKKCNNALNTVNVSGNELTDAVMNKRSETAKDAKIKNAEIEFRDNPDKLEFEKMKIKAQENGIKVFNAMKKWSMLLFNKAATCYNTISKYSK